MRTIFITVFFLLSFTILNSQNVGIGNNDPKAKLDISGDLILKSADLTLADGNTLDLDINTNKYNHYKLVGPTGNFQIGGIAAAEHDRIITLYNRSGHSLEIYNDDVNASASNRILTGTGGTFAVYPGGSLTLKYDNVIAKWEITASHYNSLDNFGSGNWSLSGNDIYNGNVGNVGINTTTPLTSLQVNGNLSLISDTVIAPCLTLIPPSMNNDILIDNTIKKKSVFHIVKDTSCSTFLSPEFIGLIGGTDGQIVTIFTHMNYTQIKHLQGLTFNPTALDSTYMIELFEPNGNGNINEPTQLTFNTGGAITLIYDGIRQKWKPINYYGEIKNDLAGWFKGPNPNNIYNPNAGNVGIGTGLPSQKLDVYGNVRVRDSLLIDENVKIENNLEVNGNIGIGISNPIFPLDINRNGIGLYHHQPSYSNSLYSYLGPSYSGLASSSGTDLELSNGNAVMKFDGFNVGISSYYGFNPNATLSVDRGTGYDGTAAFFGTTHSSHFNYSTNEDTYIRGGKNGSKIYLNDHGGQVTIGAIGATNAQLNIFSSRIGSGANGLSITQTNTNNGHDSYGLILNTSGSNLSNFGIVSDVGAGQVNNFAGLFRANNSTGVSNNIGVEGQASNSNIKNYGGKFVTNGGILSTENFGVFGEAHGPGDNIGVYGYATTSGGQDGSLSYGIYGKGFNTSPWLQYAGYFEGYVAIAGSVDVGVNVYCYELYESSDENLKRNIIPISKSMQNILKVNPVNYYWKKDENDNVLQSGVIAQEIQKIYPELVSTDKDGNLAVRYTGLIPHLIKGIQEQQSEIENLKSLLIEMKKEIATIKSEMNK